jgi:hypothetical protein
MAQPERTPTGQDAAGREVLADLGQQHLALDRVHLGEVPIERHDVSGHSERQAAGRILTDFVQANAWESYW